MKAIIRITIIRQRGRDLTSKNEDYGPDGNPDSPIPRNWLSTNHFIGSSKLDLEANTTPPDDAIKDYNEGHTAQGSGSAAHGQAISQYSNQNGADDGAQAGEEGNQGSRAAVEQVGCDGTLVGIDLTESVLFGPQLGTAGLEQLTVIRAEKHGATSAKNSG